MFQAFPSILLLFLLYGVETAAEAKAKATEHGRFVTTDALGKTGQLTATIDAGGTTAGGVKPPVADAASLVEETAKPIDEYPSYTQGKCKGVPNMTNIVKNTCEYRYYMIDILENSGAANCQFAEIRLYYEDERSGLRTWPSNRIQAVMTNVQGQQLDPCESTQDIDKGFDRTSGANSLVCAKQNGVRMILDLSETVALKHYTIISVAGKDRAADPKKWKLFGMTSTDPTADLQLLDDVQDAAFPSGDWMCDPPWTLKKPETECLATTTTTTTTTTISATTTTTTKAAWCAYRWWCFEAHSVVGGESKEWGLAEVELRFNNAMVPIKTDRSNAWWLDGVSRYAATLLDNGTEPWQSIDGDPETFARMDQSYTATINGVERKALQAKLCIDFEEPKQATHVVFAAAPEVPIPQTWSYKATNEFPTEWAKWATVAKWMNASKSAFTKGQGGYSMHRAKLVCPQPQIAPCSMANCDDGMAPAKGNLCQSWKCDENDKANCCAATR
mmetsp:Transcript_5913/g.10565  ORF Transcript_5913/g.10565 Transcript_5913/m.10565 type:complete len:502 (+) Transcript_5913:91-1596(+)